MATLADVLRNYTPPTESALADPIKQHFATLPQQLATNQTALDSAIGSWNKTDFGTGQPNPNYRPEAMQELTQLMPGMMGSTAFHGTKNEFIDFNPKKSFGDLSVTWFSPEEKVAQKYAGKEGKVIPVEIGAKKTFDFTDAKDLEVLKQKAAKINIYDPVRGSMTLDQKIPDLTEAGNYKAAEHPELFKLIKNMGYDSVAVTEDGVKNIGVFNPKKTVTRKDLLEQQVNKLKD